MTVKRAIAATACRIADVKKLTAGAGLNQSLLHERRKLPFAWRRLDHLSEQFSIAEELGPPQDRGRGAWVESKSPTKWRSPAAGASAKRKRNSQVVDGTANSTAVTHNAAQAEYDRLAALD